MSFVDGDEAGCAGQVIHDPLGHEAVRDQALRPVYVSASDLTGTKRFAGDIPSHLELEVGQADAVSAQHLAQVEGDVLAAAGPCSGRTGKGQVRVSILKLRVV